MSEIGDVARDVAAPATPTLGVTRMRRDETFRYLLALLLVTTMPAMAAWRLLGQKSDVRYYVDPDTTTAESGRHRAWVLVDEFPSADEFKSSKYLMEIDCGSTLIRTLEGPYLGPPASESRPIPRNLVPWRPMEERLLSWACR
jgi:hypothetical protein